MVDESISTCSFDPPEIERDSALFEATCHFVIRVERESMFSPGIPLSFSWVVP